MVPKTKQKWSLGRSRDHSLIFMRFGRAPFFYAFLDRQKVDPKSTKCKKSAAKGGPDGDWGAARGKERGRGGGDYRGGGKELIEYLMTPENRKVNLAKCDRRFKAEW